MSEEHHPPVKLYIFIFLSLIALTVTTVAASYAPLGGFGNIALGLAIATTKACLVGMFFMHLKWDFKDISIKYFVIFPFFLLFIFGGALIPDIAYRVSDDKTAPFENRIDRPYVPPLHEDEAAHE